MIKEISIMMDINLTSDFPMINLCNLPQGLRKSDRYRLLILLARGKDVEPPSLLEWKEIIEEIHTFSVRLAADKYKKHWSKWNTDLNLAPTVGSL